MAGDDDFVRDLERILVTERPLLIMLDTYTWDGQPIIKLLRPGATERSKPVSLSPWIFGEAGSKRHSELLYMLADMMRDGGV